MSTRAVGIDESAGNNKNKFGAHGPYVHNQPMGSRVQWFIRLPNPMPW